MQFFFYQYTTGIVLLSVAVSVSIYCDTNRIALHVSPYVAYQMTAVSSQALLNVQLKALEPRNLTYCIVLLVYDLNWLMTVLVRFNYMYKIYM